MEYARNPEVFRNWDESYTATRSYEIETKEILSATARELEEKESLLSTGNEYLGRTHHRAQPGDQICILSSCSVPVTLRRRQEEGFIQLRMPTWRASCMEI
jgi:hypothetical protein